ncbi:fungal-specific transcription factor domain-containing protein [Aspergillus pseudoustus]|uniref:Fungal-specific transcription factor domain-containing protein n=1 Tax=Aspergillus pseudoustus TaxID=1810923 RepID=A0ABR4JR86_9EURO
MRSNKPPRPPGNHAVFRVVPYPRAASEASEQQSDRSPGMMLSHSTAAMRPAPLEPLTPGSKVAIPRVSQIRSFGNRRVKRACIECREQKTKCNGHQPCGRCTSLGMECVYVDGKREAMEKRLQDLEKQVQAYDRLLTEIQPRLDSQDKELISRTRAQYASPEPEHANSDHAAHASGHGQTRSFGIEYIQEDFHKDKALQAIGFMGGPSEMSWINELYQVLEKDTPFLDSEVSNKSQSLTSVCYFLDDEELVLDAAIDPYGRPPRDIADKLLDCYFFTVHPSFPIIAKIPFMQQYEMYYTRPDIHPTKRWLTILNLVFALASKFAQLVSKQWVAEADSPMVCFTRARKLSFTESQLLEHPNLQQVQVEGLTAFFLMAIGHINRSWRACGVSVRSAIALGVNLRSESKETSNLSKEIRYRVWWSIYTLENTLSIMTGRPTSAPDKYSTTPLPIPFDEEQFREPAASRLLTDFATRTEYMLALSSQRRAGSAVWDSPGLGRAVLMQDALPNPMDISPSNSFYFFYFVDLTVIMRRAIDSLYSPGFARRPWLTISAAIMDLVQETDEWLSRIPPVFQFKIRHPSTHFERQRWSLAFRYYSLRITLSRPSLCRSERQRAPNEASALSQQRIAHICIDSACELLDLLPDKPDAVWLVQVSPWWCVLHYLMQSVTVLLIEMEFCVRFHADGASHITLHLEKGLDWLYSLGSISVPAKRAWEVCNSIYNRLFFGAGPETTILSDLRMLSPEQDPRASMMATQPVISPGREAADVMDGAAFTEPYMKLPHNMTVHPAIETPYDEIPLYKNPS